MLSVWLPTVLKIFLDLPWHCACNVLSLINITSIHLNPLHPDLFVDKQQMRERESNMILFKLVDVTKHSKECLNLHLKRFLSLYLTIMVTVPSLVILTICPQLTSYTVIANESLSLSLCNSRWSHAQWKEGGREIARPSVGGLLPWNPLHGLIGSRNSPRFPSGACHDVKRTRHQ